MPSVIDSLTLELDLGGQAKFSQQIGELNQNISKLRDQMGATAKEVESTDSKLANSFSRLKAQALGLLAVVMGGKGIKEYIGYLTTMDAATSRLSRTLGISTTELSAWQNVARLTGGTAEGMTGSIQGITSEMNRFMLTGQSAITGLLRPLGISIFNDAQQLKSASDLMLEIAGELDKRKDMSAARKAEYLRMLGFDQATINLMLRGKDVMVSMLREQKALSNVTAESAANAEKLATAWNRMLTTAENLGRAILNKLTPAFTAFLEVLSYGFQFFSGGPIPKSMQDRIDEINRKQKEKQEEIDKRLKRNMSAPDLSWMGAQPPGATGGPDLRVKPGAGSQSEVTSALAARIQESVPGVDRFTSFNDPYHALLGRSAHSEGRALDFTIKDPAQSAEIAEQVRKMIAAKGLQGRVIDEYKNPSRGSTGGHIHVQIGGVALQNPLPVGAGPASVVNNRGGDSRSSSSTSQTTIGTMNVTLPNVSDAAGFAKDIKPQMERASFAAQADAGLE